MKNKTKNKDSSKAKTKKTNDKNGDSNGEVKEGVLLTEVINEKTIVQEDPELLAKEQEEKKKHTQLEKEIKEAQEKLNFEQNQRQHIITLKKNEIEKKKRCY